MSRVSGIVALTCALVFPLSAQNPQTPFTGRWDITVTGQNGGTFPSWLEIHVSGNKTLVGEFVGRVGSARPISRIDNAGDTIRFAVPLQWEPGTADLQVEGVHTDSGMSGWLTDGEGTRMLWKAVKAPLLERAAPPSWGKPVPLFNGTDLTGWEALGGPNQWSAVAGVLTNRAAGGNLATRARYTDFKLHVEVHYPAGGNSGIYLRGRYEVQVEDSYGVEPSPYGLGGVYGFIAPNVNAARPASEWQTYDITLVGRLLTVVLNGRRVICEQPIPGITGGALDSREGEAGPIVLQGDHGPVEYRHLTITPVR